MAKAVFFLGGAQTDFARNVAREKHELADLVREVTLARWRMPRHPEHRW